MRCTARGWGLLSSVALVATLAALLSEEWLIAMAATLVVAPLVAIVSAILPKRHIEYSLQVESSVSAPGPVRTSMTASPKGRWASSRTVSPFLDSRAQGLFRLSFPTEPTVIDIDMTSVTRGTHVFGPVRETFHDPFGLVRRQRTISTQKEFLVWPEVLYLQDADVTQEALDTVSTSARRGADEFAHIRQYTPGDDPRRIHWRSSARRTSLQVRETAETQRPEITLVLGGVMSPAQFETAVSVIASLYLLLHTSTAVSVQILEIGGWKHMPFSMSQSDVMDELALLTVDDLSDDGAALELCLKRWYAPLLTCDADTLSSLETDVMGAFVVDSERSLTLSYSRYAVVQKLSDLPRAVREVLNALADASHTMRRSRKP